MNEGNAVTNAKMKMNSIDWCVPTYIPSIEQQNILMKQIVDKTPTELRCIERSVFSKEVITQTFWDFDPGTQEGINFPISIFIVFQESDR